MSKKGKDGNIIDLFPKEGAESADKVEKEQEQGQGQNRNQSQGQEEYLDRDKLNKVLDSFLEEEEEAKKKEEERRLRIEKRKKTKRRVKAVSFILFALFVLFLIITNPNVQNYNKSRKEALLPKEEYSMGYNYSVGMKIIPMGENIALYDSNNLRLLKKTGEGIFDIPFGIGSWDMAASDKAIYILDKIDYVLYFINASGDFVNKVNLTNIPHKLYAGAAGNLALHYKSESGVEGVALYDRTGRLLSDTTYPKTTITMVNINTENKTTVHGMHRVASRIENSVYRYSDKGSLIFSKAYPDLAFVRQYEDKTTIAFVDVNKIQFYNKNVNENGNLVSSIIPLKSISFDPQESKVYLLDKRNKLRILDMQGNILEERHFQMDYKKVLAYKGEALLIGDDFIRSSKKEIKMNAPIEDLFLLGDYLVIVSKNEIRLVNKLD